MTQKTNPFEDDNFAKHLGIELVELGRGRAQAKLEMKDIHLNGMGVMHGGAIFSLAAWTFALAANSHGNMAIGINASVSFVTAVREGTLTAKAREISLNQRLSTYSVDVTDENGTLIATFQGTAYRKAGKKSKE